MGKNSKRTPAATRKAKPAPATSRKTAAAIAKAAEQVRRRTFLADLVTALRAARSTMAADPVASHCPDDAEETRMARQITASLIGEKSAALVFEPRFTIRVPRRAQRVAPLPSWSELPIFTPSGNGDYTRLWPN